MGLVSIQNRLIIKGASREKDHSVLLRIITNYFQVIMLVKDLDLHWPKAVQRFLSSITFVSAASNDLFQVDCFFKGSKYSAVSNTTV